jgi:hypothetical protein
MIPSILFWGVMGGGAWLWDREPSWFGRKSSYYSVAMEQLPAPDKVG